MKIRRKGVIAAALVLLALGGDLGASVTNFSALIQVPAAGNSAALGFVVDTTSNFLVRAVGPSLAQFGVRNVAALPQIHYFDSEGAEIFTTRTADVKNWPSAFASVGAFPLSATGDAVDAPGFPPGAYTVSLSDASGKGGTALLEFYANPVFTYPAPVANGP